MITQISLDPKLIKIGTRYRTDNELDEEFLESIKTKGLLQPITISKDHILVAGGRRLAASLQLGLQEVPCLVRDIENELDLRECELIENIHRRDLNWLNRNALVSRINDLMTEKHGSWGSQARTAELLNKSVGGIARHVQLSKAIKIFPKLAECKTEDEAVKMFRRVSEQVIVKELVKQQQERVANTVEEEHKKLPLGVQMASYAESHFRIQDAFIGMQELLDDKLNPPITLVEIDPPYSINLTEVKKGDLNKGISTYNEIAPENYIAFLDRTCELTYKVTPKEVRVIFWFAIEWYETVSQALRRASFDHDPIPCIWVKPTGQTASPDNYLARSYETFFVAWKSGQKPNPIQKRGRSNVFSFSPTPHSEKYHPTQRPIQLMQEILRTFAWPGSLVLVPFLGSGATLRAAYTLAISGWGWELSSEYKDGFLGQVEKDLREGLYNEFATEDSK